MSSRRFSVLSLNIHKGLSPLNRRVIVHDLRDRLHAASPDIVFLQEVQDAHDRHLARRADWPALAQSSYLAGNLWPEIHYGRNAVYDHGHHGNLILSRFQVKAVRNDDISEHRYERRGLLHAIVEAGGVHVHCFCVHLGLFERGRRRQIDAIIAAIAERAPADEPVIVAGDFNDWRNFAEASRRIRFRNPSNSLLLLKPTNRVQHGGGQQIKDGSPEFKALVDWIGGAK